jgi:enamine deaminase RidA (YjgF/YER057c/UK114 family)
MTKDNEISLLRGGELSEPIGLYSHGAIIATPASLLYVAGQLAVDENGSVVGERDFAAQVHQVFSNLGRVLRAGEMDFSNVLKFTTYLTNSFHLEEFYAVRAELFTTIYPTAEYPPNTLLVVERLVQAEFLIEIEAVAGRN